MHTKKKYLSLMLAVAMLLSLFSFTTSSSAATAMQSMSARCSPDGTWAIRLTRRAPTKLHGATRLSRRLLYSRLPLKALKAFEFR